jgi:dynein heavy chain
VTEEGLEDQLLAVVVTKERPDLEEMKAKLITEQNEFKIKLKELEDGLLKRLASAQGDLTEDVELIESLEEMKRIADDIKSRMKIAVVTEIKINKTREIYRPVAARGALLFFLLMNLRKINIFYQYSLAAFKTVFLRGIDRLPKIIEAPVDPDAAAAAAEGAPPAPTAEGASAPAAAGAEEEVVADAALLERISGLVSAITFAVFQYTRRGLFEKHKLIMSTQLTFKILAKSGQLDERELEFLIQGKRAAAPAPMGERLAQFITEANWASVQALMELPAFSALGEDMQKFAPGWEKWCSEEKAEVAELPHQVRIAVPVSVCVSDLVIGSRPVQVEHADQVPKAAGGARAAPRPPDQRSGRLCRVHSGPALCRAGAVRHRGDLQGDQQRDTAVLRSVPRRSTVQGPRVLG